mgnify:CR=1 FL=1
MAIDNSTLTFDSAKLSQYLAKQVSNFGDLTDIEKFAGGQSNPTYKITTQDGEQQRTFVLRKQPTGKILKSAHAVDREFQVLNALKGSSIPVARVHHLCRDTDIIGEMFYLMDFCDGNIHWDAPLGNIADNQTRHSMYDEMNHVLVEMHSLNIEQFGLSDFGKAGNYFNRQISRWITQYRASEIDTIPAMESLYTWLEHHQPQDDGRISLVHGDYRLDNLMFAKDNSKIIAVLDWELSTLGHPFADLAYQCMQLRMPQGIGSIDGLKGIDRQSLGIPTEQEYVQRYCERMNITEINNWSFYLAFSFFRLAAIVQGVAKRAQLGNASNTNAKKVGAFVEPLALMALDIINKE